MDDIDQQLEPFRQACAASFAPLADFTAAATTAMQALGVAMAPLLAQINEAVVPAIGNWWDACRERYRAAGAPYGDTDEGMLMWLRDRRDAVVD